VTADDRKLAFLGALFVGFFLLVEIGAVIMAGGRYGWSGVGLALTICGAVDAILVAIAIRSLSPKPRASDSDPDQRRAG
jgi:hypothetical protein